MSQEVRLAVERAISKLIGRFGTQAQVIGELRHALTLMEREEAPASSGGMDAVSVEVSEPVQPPAPSTPTASKPEPPAQTSEEDGERVDASNDNEGAVEQRKPARKQHRRKA